MPRLTFWQVFQLLNDNTLQVSRKIKIGSVEFDEGATITKGTIVGGIDFFNYINRSNVEIEADTQDDALVMNSIFYTPDGK